MRFFISKFSYLVLLTLYTYGCIQVPSFIDQPAQEEMEVDREDMRVDREDMRVDQEDMRMDQADMEVDQDDMEVNQDDMSDQMSPEGDLGGPDQDQPICGDGAVGVDEECDGGDFCGVDCRYLAPCAGECPDIVWVTIERGPYILDIIPPVDEDLTFNPTEIDIEYDYKLSKTEVTVAQYRACVVADVCAAPSTYDSMTEDSTLCNWDIDGRDDHPINCINRLEALIFARWVGATLPSLTEWTFAAQSREIAQPYPWGGDPPSCGHVVYQGSDEDPCDTTSTAPVCSRPEGNSAQGLCDLMGNVSELILDQRGVLDQLGADGSPACGENGCEDIGDGYTKGGGWEDQERIESGVRSLTTYRTHRPPEELERQLVGGGDPFNKDPWSGIRLRRLRADDAPIGDLCGDGIQGESEECDDGNRALESCEYGVTECTVCDSNCDLIQGEPAFCGDGYISRPREECDGTNSCQADCKLAPCASNWACPIMDFSLLEAGQFEMGRGLIATWDNVPLILRWVTVTPFKMSVSEVTVSQYRKCVEDEHCEEPDCELRTQFTETLEPSSGATWPESCNYAHRRENHPVNYIDKRMSYTFAEWVGGRLPSEAEWEYAATGGGQNTYPWGDMPSPNCSNSNTDYCTETSMDEVFTTEVCQLPGGHSPQGVCDLIGNVFEWVMDSYHETYEDAPTTSAPWCDDDCLEERPDYDALLRGSSFKDSGNLLAPEVRFRNGNELKTAALGARIVKPSVCGDGAIQPHEECDECDCTKRHDPQLPGSQVHILAKHVAHVSGVQAPAALRLEEVCVL